MPLKRLKPSSKIFYWLFQWGTSFVDILCCFFFLSCVCYVFVSVWLYVPCCHLLTSCFGSRLWCPTVSLLLSHWYPGSGVVLDCIDSLSLHPYFVCSSTKIMRRIIYLQGKNVPPHTWCNDSRYPVFVNFCYFPYFWKNKKCAKTSSRLEINHSNIFYIKM